MKKVFIEEHEAPPRKCKNPDCKMASTCFMRDACWNIGQGRRKLSAEERQGPGNS